MKSERISSIPGLFISALRGGSGKTILTIGITAALRSLGKQVAPFKKGPDYIDAGWLSLAAGNPCYNLDTYLIDHDTVVSSYLANSAKLGADIAIVEGNRGLFDGIDIDGKTSTAETAKLLEAPVVLVLDCSKSTRTMAAAVLGCLHFDPELTIGGVILNRIAGPRHKNNLINNIEYHTGVPVIGAVPKLRSHDFPERHMGLVPTPEHDWAFESVRNAETIIREHVDVPRIIALSETAASFERNVRVPEAGSAATTTDKPVIGVIRDASFQFYYPENIEALEAEGAQVVMISPLRDTELPEELDGVYIGGGFPETHARELGENVSFRESLLARIKEGMPLYAECGGLIYMGEELEVDGVVHPMTGLFPLSFSVSKRPQGHGYVVAEITGENPFYEVGTQIKGHEFRYSKITRWDREENDAAFTMARGTGMADKADGITKYNALATYTHIHALGTPAWAPSFVSKALEYKNHE
ncbi:cobyrinate a,c-diamide synthase [Desulfoluna spongiiphila]|uniref:Cobyrinate a,c-diamide synthase n=1 Tax=Desulfoluna spongiiphila TaxID=419481 RepID=A0A1G5J675_9BACT|nr:cobyrinate a,c-diamide synthase [Desulfoluna spongiiphila]SCY83451.1 cobyrinic acid a,c-diamide synthase [Desulfoluna spongiiphila]